MTPLQTFIAAAWSSYSVDPRLNAPPFQGSAQKAPDDLGAFQYACALAGPSSVRFVERAYRHYQNEMTRSGKEMEVAFAEGVGLAYAELGGFGN